MFLIYFSATSRDGDHTKDQAQVKTSSSEIAKMLNNHGKKIKYDGNTSGQNLAEPT